MIHGVSLHRSVPDYRLLSVFESNWYLNSLQKITLNIINFWRIHASSFLVVWYLPSKLRCRKGL